VQRVPVRIEIDPKQLADHPLRLGLSMSVNVAIRDQSGPMLAAAAKNPQPFLATQAYDKQLSDADALIAKIIRQNLPGRGQN
jgi:membrane fusion protein (multidrug efflux system)